METKVIIAFIVMLAVLFIPAMLLGMITGLFGPKGLVSYLFAFLWLLTTLFYLLFAWHGVFNGNQIAAAWAKSTFVLGCIFVLIAYFSSEMGTGYMPCPTIGCETNGKYTELEATRDMIGKPVKCPKCKEGQLKVTKDWWN